MDKKGGRRGEAGSGMEPGERYEYEGGLERFYLDEWVVHVMGLADEPGTYRPLS